MPVSRWVTANPNRTPKPPKGKGSTEKPPPLLWSQGRVPPGSQVETRSPGVRVSGGGPLGGDQALLAGVGRLLPGGPRREPPLFLSVRTRPAVRGPKRALARPGWHPDHGLPGRFRCVSTPRWYFGKAARAHGAQEPQGAESWPSARGPPECRRVPPAAGEEELGDFPSVVVTHPRCDPAVLLSVVTQKK